MLLQHYLEQGLSKAEIARQLGISRDTIHRMIRNGDLQRDPREVRYGPRPPVMTKLDPFKSIVQARLREFPELTATRLLDEIRAAGYTGGITQLRDHVRGIRPQPVPEPVVRFETAPAHQGQVDFAHFRFPWGVRYALLVILSYSRLLWLRFYRRQDLGTLLDGLETAFAFFGGVPRELLFDQMRSVIVRDLRPEGGRLVENAEFLRFWPIERFLRDEKSHLTPLASRGYRPVVLRLERTPERKRIAAVTPAVDVERRPLTAYAAAVGGGA